MHCALMLAFIAVCFAAAAPTLAAPAVPTAPLENPTVRPKYKPLYELLQTQVAASQALVDKMPARTTANMVKGMYSTTGAFYQQLIAQYTSP